VSNETLNPKLNPVKRGGSVVNLRSTQVCQKSPNVKLKWAQKSTQGSNEPNYHGSHVRTSATGYLPLNYILFTTELYSSIVKTSSVVHN